MSPQQLLFMVFCWASLALVFSEDALSGDTDVKVKLNDTKSWNCPEYSYGIYGYDIGDYNDVGSWQECALLCQETKYCDFWSWGVPRGVWSNRCVLKNSDDGAGVYIDWMSGTKDCFTVC
eukprot:TRINITY_DN57597_c0_g1_i1.p1 TRINITY_DN57597_c0_g1~~TRINITY_DN57597_c0_g1_i1.p1  ORF type:complete len:127 (-),score=6.91 TRINITY_DN57597_c0_g1_i1:23-382(-)